MNDFSADVSDNATVEEARHLALALSIRKQELTPKGACYNCHESIDTLFCDVDCREDWEKRNRR